jgi:hypothetical protein
MVAAVEVEEVEYHNQKNLLDKVEEAVAYYSLKNLLGKVEAYLALV